MRIRIKIDYVKIAPDVAQYCINEIYGEKWIEVITKSESATLKVKKILNEN